MNNFIYHNPTKIIFGKNQIAKITSLIPADKKILLTYGTGSIKQNGVYEQVMAALKGKTVLEFGGIEPNPLFETLMKAVQIVKNESVDFILAVGGGSVVDGSKFISVAAPYTGSEPWDILTKNVTLTSALPVGCVLTLPATGTESNGNAVISRRASEEKFALHSPLVYPVFSVLDPETTYSLPERQIINGIVDAFVHVMEQYMTFPSNAPLQDRQAEAILQTLVGEAPAILRSPPDYQSRATFFWCTTQALNGLIGCGVPQDWATHMIGHELTALYGLDHAQSLAIVLPRLLMAQKETKREKLVQYGTRLFGLSQTNTDDLVVTAISQTETFFRSLGMKTRLADYNIQASDAAHKISARFKSRGVVLGEQQDISPERVDKILAAC